MASVDPFENQSDDEDLFFEIESVQQDLRENWVWSSGLEAWEPAILSFNDWTGLRFLHSKTMFGMKVNIFRDSLGRYIASRTL